jgi:uncharacterized protein (DUF1501 family)
MDHRFDRRDALASGVRCLFAAAGLSLARRLPGLGPPAHPAADYRALVCVDLAGGNDSFNLLVPTSAADHGAYMAARGNLGIPASQLLPIQPARPQGRTFGLHPAVPELQALFAAGRLAFVVNVGTLLAPLTKAQYRSHAVPRPAQLFSHSDQAVQWQAPSADAAGGHGWAGRLGDLLLSLNGGSALSPSITLAGSTRLLQGENVVPYGLGTQGSVALTGFSGPRGQRRLAALRQILRLPHGHPMEAHFADLQEQAIELDAVIRTALAAQGSLATPFPNNSLGRQLHMVARMIGVRQTLGVARQVFFVRLGGFDTHSDQLAFHPQLLSTLALALKAFQDAMAELGTTDAVTTFTTSEFGRTLGSNGSGSDHGWGGNQLVLGGAVRGRDLYGTWPSLASDGPDDLGRGRILPTTAVEQMGATLARWFGLPANEMATVFPRLGRFASADLGFMGP